MKEFLSTKEVAHFLNINEKMVYILVAEKGLPATKVTGKWLFPKQLIEQWIETNTINYPDSKIQLPPYQGLLIMTGSNDPLLDKTLHLFNTTHSGQVAVFGNLGSMGGLRALRQNLCHIASSHLLQEDENEYNFDFASQELQAMPAVVNFCRREQGILVQKGNPKTIKEIADFANPDIRIVNRPLGTGTRLLLDRELKKAGVESKKISGYAHEVHRHLNVGLEILADRADAGLGIRAVAGLLDLDFISLRWERYDLMISKERFFDEGIQKFIGILHDTKFQKMATQEFVGYDVSLSGKMVYPQESEKEQR
ncbi:MAG: helix-turn-helix transcriptional regulator [Deltaproteobacteria bacterium]|nr:helix-turn-helix transcriptional regulator [Deltaproteobacteria bacterium]